MPPFVNNISLIAPMLAQPCLAAQKASAREDWKHALRFAKDCISGARRLSRADLPYLNIIRDAARALHDGPTELQAIRSCLKIIGEGTLSTEVVRLTRRRAELERELAAPAPTSEPSSTQGIENQIEVAAVSGKVLDVDEWDGVDGKNGLVHEISTRWQNGGLRGLNLFLQRSVTADWTIDSRILESLKNLEGKRKIAGKAAYGIDLKAIGEIEERQEKR